MLKHPLTGDEVMRDLPWGGGHLFFSRRGLKKAITTGLAHHRTPCLPVLARGKRSEESPGLPKTAGWAEAQFLLSSRRDQRPAVIPRRQRLSSGWADAEHSASTQDQAFLARLSTNLLRRKETRPHERGPSTCAQKFGAVGSHVPPPREVPHCPVDEEGQGGSERDSDMTH